MDAADIVFRDMGLPKDVDEGLSNLAAKWGVSPNEAIWRLVRSEVGKRADWSISPATRHSGVPSRQEMYRILKQKSIELQSKPQDE